MSSAFQDALTEHGLTVHETGRYNSAGYLCPECLAWEDELNSWDECKACAAAKPVSVWITIDD